MSFFSQAFGSTIPFLVRCSEPHLPAFKTFIFFSLEFKVTVPFTICRRSEQYSQPLEPSFTVWRSKQCLFLAFEAIVQLSIWSHYIPLVLAFRVVMHTHSRTQSHHLSSVWCSESFFSSFVIRSHGSQHSCSLALCIRSSQFYIRPHFSYLVTLCLSLIHHALLDFPFPCT